MPSLGRIVETERRFAFKLIKPSMSVLDEGSCLQLKGLMLVRSGEAAATEDLEFFLGEYACTTEVEALFSFGNRRFFRVRILVPIADIFTLPIHSVLCVRVNDGAGGFSSHGLMYSALVPVYLALHTRLFRASAEGLVAYFSQNAGKGVTFTVRHANVTDSFAARMKLRSAWLISKLAFWINPVLVFEKNGCHYEESGRAVFEELVDRGCSDVRFVLSEAALQKCSLEEPYRSSVVVQHSFLHYLHFFRCRTFLGTEALAHALELRCQSLLVQRKIKSKKNTYVFLQHGVMYMVSLDSPQRSSFRRSGMKGDPYVVVSSQREAEHFMDLGDFRKEELIVSGLPKFDRSYMNAGAEKILVMPTWRIWEFNEMRHDPSTTKYARMIERIVGAVPADLRDKVVVANHPLFAGSTFLGGNLQDIGSYDELLRDVSLLITDYSSIAYDAFYRGANVVFYWEELEECMEHYGGDTHLMLTDDTAFGPVCRNGSELASTLEELYGSSQPDAYIDRYREIVEFHDGKNTERLLDCLRAKGVIEFV